MSSAYGSLESLFLAGEAGKLEAMLNHGSPEADYACLVCHPHPLFGGTMHNKVVYQAMKALNGLGLPVLRFNFRGVGASAGAHDNGRGEAADVRTGLDYLASHYSLPLLFVGFSFGVTAGLSMAAAHPRVKGLILLGTPVNVNGQQFHYDSISGIAQPKLFVSGTADRFASPAQLEQIAAAAAEPKRLVLIPEADHSFTGHLDEMREAVRLWVLEVVRGAATDAEPLQDERPRD